MIKSMTDNAVSMLRSRPIYSAIEKQYKKMAERKWDKMYWAIDIHDTLIPSTYAAVRVWEDGVATYPGVQAMLGLIMDCPENHIILWSSLPGSGPTGMVAHKKALFPIERWARVQLNENRLERGNEYADFSQKFYFNVLLDDKAGFDPSVDIQAVMLAIMNFRHIYMEHLK